MIDQLSPDQERAAEAIEDFIRAARSGGKQFFVLHGLAGTGKTYLWSELARRYPGATLVAPTGKAASVLRKKSGQPAHTIHSVIYNFLGLEDDEEENRKILIFEEKGVDLFDKLVFLDESSMCGKSVAEALLRTGATVVACGDPGQLPPVRDKPFFTEADFTLTEVHRQAWDSPIIRQAHLVRREGRYEPDGEGFRVVFFATPEMILEADIILCYLNITRQRLNARKRLLLGKSGRMKKGEPVMCLNTNRKAGIYNGEVARLAADRAGLRSLTLQTDEGRFFTVANATIEGEEDFEDLRYDDQFTPFAPAYACTVHKAEGSEFPNVLLFDERPREGATFLYTGITRAIDKCTVVSWK